MRGWLGCLLLVLGCQRTPEPSQAERVRLWHTFQPHETAALNTYLARVSLPVEASMLALPRGLILLRNEFSRAKDCPDLVRVDATWLPALVDYLTPVPEVVWRAGSWLPEARELAVVGGTAYGLPQSVDGLMLLYRNGVRPDRWRPRSLDDVFSGASGSGSMGVRVDGYWFVPFLRAQGQNVTVDMDTIQAGAALNDFARLFGPSGVAAPMRVGEEERRETQLFLSGQMEVAINGPWAAHRLGAGDLSALRVAPLPMAPRGGTLWVVPRCSPRQRTAWRVASQLLPFSSELADRFAVIPTTEEGLAQASPLVRGMYDALRGARPLPMNALTPELFDDLTPALRAVVSGNATAEEALSGLARSWRRIAQRKVTL